MSVSTFFVVLSLITSSTLVSFKLQVGFHLFHSSTSDPKSGVYPACPPPSLVLASALGDNTTIYNSVQKTNKVTESIMRDGWGADGFHLPPVIS